ncbi:MAG: DUF4864 domain-containing protein [Pseudomonadota bacterium]|nr:DUF4864 domain-containing protein [Pseudomonadota bacterium]
MRHRKPPVLFMLAVLLQMSSVFAWADHAKPSFNVADENEIKVVVRAQLNAFRQGQFDLAYGYASDNIKRRFPNSVAFMTMVEEGYAVLLNPLSVRFDGLDQRLDIPVYQVQLIASDGYRWLALYPMVKDDSGAWKINGCQIFQLTRELV